MPGNLGKRLVQELKRGGKKTVVLALLFCVGLFFWLPMVWKSIFVSGTKSATPPRPQPKALVPAVASDTAAPLPPAATADWKRLHRQIEHSPLVEPITLDELVRDPFSRAWIREKKLASTEGSEKESAANDPNQFLVLTATLAGSEQGAAVISDRVYRRGDEVPREGPIRFVLKDIRADRVVLERAGNSYELRMTEQKGEP